MRLHMEYDSFKNEFKSFNDWSDDYFRLDSALMHEPISGASSKDVIVFGDYKKSDSVNSPAHYTRGSKEAIDIIEEAIQDAPTVENGMLQAQVLKYLLRLWLKDNPTEDAKKAQWYLKRLISKLES